MSQAEITEYRICHIRAGSLPAAGIKTLQPYPGSAVQMGYGCRDLTLDNIGGQSGLIIARSLIPFHCPEIITEFRNVLSSSPVITAKSHSPAFMPFIYRFKISFLA